jgi:hypothetical protein
MKTAAPFDRLVEQHYLGIYQMTVDLVSDPLTAARVTDRALRHRARPDVHAKQNGRDPSQADEDRLSGMRGR